MIGFLRGKVYALKEDSCLLDVHGVGYNVLMSTQNISELKKDGEVLIHTHMIVREDAMFLCGFLRSNEQNLFQKLIAISGIGAKAALAVLSAMQVADFILAIQTQNIKVLTGIPGIGKKTAERLILELKGKFEEVAVDSVHTDRVATPVEDNALRDVVLALQALGYDGARALSIVRAVYRPEMSVEQCIKLCLKELMQG